MCRMALIFTKEPVTEIDNEMYKVWLYNKDGVGELYHDNKGWHIRRFSKTEDFKPLSEPYDRLLIHFRASTGGKGTHPFSVEGALGWYMTHNGSIHEMYNIYSNNADEIDSLKAVRLWGETYNPTKTLEENIKEFGKRVDEKYAGTFNFLLYNFVTDEWVAVSDGSLSYAKTDEMLIIASDFKFDQEIEKKATEIKAGHYIYGKGTEIQGEGTWADRSFKNYVCNSCNTTTPTPYTDYASFSYAEEAADLLTNSNTDINTIKKLFPIKSSKKNKITFKDGSELWFDANGFPSKIKVDERDGSYVNEWGDIE